MASFRRQSRKAGRACWLLSPLLILAVGLLSGCAWALTAADLPQNGQILVVEDDFHLELGSGEAAFLNGTILLRGDGITGPIMVLNNTGTLRLGAVASMNATDGGRLVITNSGNVTGARLALDSSEGNISVHNRGWLSVDQIQFLATEGGVGEFVNSGIVSSNYSLFALASDGPVRSTLCLRILGGEFSSHDAQATSAGGEVLIDCAGNLTLYNLALRGEAGARIDVRNVGEITVQNANLQNYASTLCIDNPGVLHIPNAYLKDQNDEYEGELCGTRIASSGQINISNFSIISNGDLGLVQLDLGGVARVDNLNCDANYGGRILLTSLDGSTIFLGNANLDASGYSHGIQSQILLHICAAGNLTMNNALFASRSGSTALLNSGSLEIVNYNGVSGDGGSMAIENHGDASIRNMRITTSKATAAVRNTGTIAFRDLVVEDQEDSTQIYNNGTLEGNNVALKAIGGKGRIVLNATGFIEAENLFLEASRGGAIVLEALDATLTLGRLLLNSTGEDKGYGSSITMLNGPGVMANEAEAVGLLLQDLSVPGGPSEWLLTSPSGGEVRMTNYGEGIVIGQRYAFSLAAGFSLIGLIRMGRQSRGQKGSRGKPVQSHGGTY